MVTSTQLGPELLERQGNRIKRARDWIGYTQAELAKAVSDITKEPISRNIISQLEIGRREATGREMRAISMVTGQERDWLEAAGGQFREDVDRAKGLSRNRVYGGLRQPAPALAA